MTIIRPDRALYFANIENVLEDIERILRGRKTKVLIVDCEAVNFIDATAIDEIKHFLGEKHAAGLEVISVNLNEEIRAAFRRSGLEEYVTSNALFTGKGHAIKEGVSFLSESDCRSCTLRVFLECKTTKAS